MERSQDYFDLDNQVRWRLSDFDYDLPPDRIAQYPLPRRDSSRLMVLHRTAGKVEHRRFRDIVSYIEPGSCLVLNNTKVFPARLKGIKDKTGARIEVFLLRNLENGIWEVLVKPARKVRLGNRIIFSEEFVCDVIDNTVSGGRIVEFHCNGKFFEYLDELGNTPLPPYIKRPPEEIDKEYYQTVYAKVPGAVAAPTAGLHFTSELLQQVKQKGVKIAHVTLHVGLGTFKPVQVEDVSRHQMDSEFYSISQESADLINNTRRAGGYVVAVGSTTVRVLETVADRHGFVRACRGWTDKFIYPPYHFRTVDKLVTNFHLPKSTLLMMVSAFSDYDLVMSAYRTAVEEGYRFFSYGDAMLLL